MIDRYALLGNPVAHSKSPQIHTSFAAATGQLIAYDKIEIQLDQPHAFIDAANSFRAQGGKGLNITMPFKLDAFGYATRLSERATRAKAVNIIKFESGEIFADNSDGEGLVIDIERNLEVSVEGKRVLLLGAGGAARGTVWPLLQRMPAQLVITNRTLSKAQDIVEDFADASVLSACDINALAAKAMQPFDIVINATSTSLNAQALVLPAALFASHALAYDMVYGKGLTAFLRQARDAGAAQVADGTGMLVEQAAIAFEWWRGVKPGTREVIELISVALD
jgi:shikimate dehydrogenase